MRLPVAVVLPLIFGLVACAMPETPDEIVFAEASIVGADGVKRGDVAITQLDTGIRVVIRGDGLNPGVYGAHIHEIGTCDAPDFATAGGHWNPLDREHGRSNPAGQHLGDMPNLLVGQDNRGTLEVAINGARISNGPLALLDQDGAAIMIHAMPDDYRTNPSGDAGARLLCGVIQPSD